MENITNNDFDGVSYSEKEREAMLGKLILITEEYNQETLSQELRRIAISHFDR